MSQTSKFSQLTLLREKQSAWHPQCKSSAQQQSKRHCVDHLLHINQVVLKVVNVQKRVAVHLQEQPISQHWL